MSTVRRFQLVDGILRFGRIGPIGNRIRSRRWQSAPKSLEVLRTSRSLLDCRSVSL